MRQIAHKTAILVGLAGVLAFGAAQAQPAYPQSGYPQQGGGYQDQGGPDQGPDIRAALRLRPDQEAAWRAFQVATNPSEAEIQQAQADAQRLPSLPTPQRLDALGAQLDRERAAFATRSAAIKRFYAQLTPEQQRTFDEVTAPQPEPGEAGQGQGAGGYPPQR